MLDAGFGKNLSTTTLQKGIYAFIFDQKGLMGGVGIQGSKITKINPYPSERYWCARHWNIEQVSIRSELDAFSSDRFDEPGYVWMNLKEKTMRIDFVKKTISVAMVIMLFGFAPLSLAQDKPADNMQILRDKIKADKKLVVAANMELTETEAKGFWPIYEEYQKDLQKINRRIAKLLDSYAD